MPDANPQPESGLNSLAEPRLLSRRDALRVALIGGAALASLPVSTGESANLQVESANDAFLPENDYPYFGYNPDGAG